MLVENQKLVKFFTVNSPLAAVFGYQLTAKVPWMVLPLGKLERDMFKLRLGKEATEMLANICVYNIVYKSLAVQLGIAQGIKLIIAQLTNPPIGAAKLQSAIFILNFWQDTCIRVESEPGTVRLVGLRELINKFEDLELNADPWPILTS